MFLRESYAYNHEYFTLYREFKRSITKMSPATLCLRWKIFVSSLDFGWGSFEYSHLFLLITFSRDTDPLLSPGSDPRLSPDTDPRLPWIVGGECLWASATDRIASSYRFCASSMLFSWASFRLWPTMEYRRFSRMWLCRLLSLCKCEWWSAWCSPCLESRWDGRMLCESWWSRGIGRAPWGWWSRDPAWSWPCFARAPCCWSSWCARFTCAPWELTWWSLVPWWSRDWESCFVFSRGEGLCSR